MHSVIVTSRQRIIQYEDCDDDVENALKLRLLSDLLATVTAFETMKILQSLAVLKIETVK